MGWRFRRRIKIAPGFRLNLSRSGASTSIGRSGATLNVGGKRGPRVTVGLPGSGLFYVKQLTTMSGDSRPGWRALSVVAVVALGCVIGALATHS